MLKKYMFNGESKKHEEIFKQCIFLVISSRDLNTLCKYFMSGKIITLVPKLVMQNNRFVSL